MTNKIKKWWNENSAYYQQDADIQVKNAHYGPYSPDEDKLQLLGDIRGKKILELGCGGGQCSVAFAREGAISTGVDFSSAQLKFAKKLAKEHKVNVNFVKGDIQTLPSFLSNSFDIVFSAFAFIYIKDLTKCFKEAHRVLKPNGLFVFSTEHPFSAIFRQKTQKVKRSYFLTGKYEKKTERPDGSKHTFVIYRRKVSEIFNSLIEAGFTVNKILEPLDLKQKSWRKIYRKKMVKLVGPTIIFKATRD